MCFLCSDLSDAHSFTSNSCFIIFIYFILPNFHNFSVGVEVLEGA